MGVIIFAKDQVACCSSYSDARVQQGGGPEGEDVEEVEQQRGLTPLRLSQGEAGQQFGD